MQPVMARRQGVAPRWIWPAALALLVLAIVVAIRFLNPPHTWAGMFMEPPMPVNDFSLTAAGDKPVRISDFRGKLVALYFGCLLYTSPSPRDRTRSRMPSSA